MAGWKPLNNFFAAYHRVINKSFSAYGSYLAHKPYLPLCLGIILLGGFCFGLFKYNKESNLENLWVEHGSRVVEEKSYFNSRFGGIARQEIVAIINKGRPDDQLPLATAFDALTYSIKPLFDNLTWETTVPGTTRTANLTQKDFCERPLVPPQLMPGSNPVVDGNWLSYGYQFLSNCSLEATFANLSTNATYTPLPQGWGIDYFPCTKLTPMDCFQEGGDYDYPLPLRQLETVQPARAGSIFTLVDITAQFQTRSPACQNALAAYINSTFEQAGVPASKYASLTPEIVQGTVIQASSFFTWGYRWRKSYKSLQSNQAIMDHINSALKLAEAWDPNPTDPQVVQCIKQQQPCCLTWFGLHTPILAAFGSLTQDPISGNITKIGAIRWAQDNFNENQPLWDQYISNVLQANFTSDQYKGLHQGWESQMINTLLPLRNRENNNLYAGNNSYSDLQLEFLTWRSVQDIIADSGKTPIWQIILSVVLTSIYAYLAFVNFRDAVHSHTWLVLTGMTVVALAILSGFGFTSLIDIKISPIQGGVVPFLALAIGVDDVFVLSNTLRSYLSDARLQTMAKGSVIPEREMRLTLALAGPSVILTTFTVLAAFFISSVNPMPISQWFCWQMGITASIHTVGLMLIFFPVMAIDARRCKVSEKCSRKKCRCQNRIASVCTG
jgi:patched 2 protein